MALVSLCCLLAGATVAVAAPRDPPRQATWEGIAGGLIVLGLVLVGAGLPIFR